MRSLNWKSSLLAVGCCALVFANSSGARADQFSAPLGPGGTWNVYQPVFGDINWTTARTNALAQNFSGTQGRLISINSQAENEFGQRLIRTGSSGWIGFTDDAAFPGTSEQGDTSGQPYPTRGSGYVWADATGGEAVVTDPGFWGGGEPNNSGGENYAHYNGNFGWNDLPNNNQGSYVIEYPLNAANDPLPQPAFLGGPYGGMGYMDVREVQGNAVGDIPSAINSLTNPGGATVNNYTAPMLNIRDSDGNGHFGNDALFVSDPDQVNATTNTVDNIAVQATGIVRIHTAGDYTFGVNSDDGFRLTIKDHKFHSSAGQGGTQVVNGSLQFPNGRGADDSFGTVNLPVGDHQFQLVYWEGNGGASVELMAAAGQHTGFNTNFNLIGGAAIPGQPAVFQNFQSKLQTVSAWNYTEYNSNNLGDIIASGRLGSDQGNAVTRGSSNPAVINFADPQGANDGGHPSVAFPFDTGGDDDNFGAYATTTLDIAAGDADRYSFLMYTDDDSRFRILSGGVPLPLVGTTNGDQFDSDGVNGNDQFGTNGCCFDQIGHYDLAVGTYTIEAAFHEGGGGSGFLLFGTKGEFNTFSPVFQLIGANLDQIVSVQVTPAIPDTPAGLELVPEPSSVFLALVSACGLVLVRRRRR